MFSQARVSESAQGKERYASSPIGVGLIGPRRGDVARGSARLEASRGRFAHSPWRRRKFWTRGARRRGPRGARLVSGHDPRTLNPEAAKFCDESTVKRFTPVATDLSLRPMLRPAKTYTARSIYRLRTLPVVVVVVIVVVVSLPFPNVVVHRRSRAVPSQPDAPVFVPNLTPV